MNINPFHPESTAQSSLPSEAITASVLTEQAGYTGIIQALEKAFPGLGPDIPDRPFSPADLATPAMGALVTLSQQTPPANLS